MKRTVLFLLLLALPALVSGQAIEYKRNGECYLLIGHNDAKFRGVYRLNNPSGEAEGEPVGDKLSLTRALLTVFQSISTARSTLFLKIKRRLSLSATGNSSAS